MSPSESALPALTRFERPAKADARILLALSEQERGLFFPGDSLREYPQIQYAEACGTDREAWNQLLAGIRPTVLITGWSTPALVASHCIQQGGPVDYICHVVGSVRHIVTKDAIDAGLKVTNWGSLIAPQVAEHALLTILALMRNLGLWREAMLAPPAGRNREQLATRTLHGKNVAIHGFGLIARELIALLRPFNTDIRVYSAGVPDSLIREHQATPVNSLAGLAEHADVFVTCEALTPATVGSIDASVLSRLPAGSIFVNVGRGAIVDEKALIETARTRGLRVGSDVFACEPLAADSPLFQLPGAILSPHIAGPTFDTYAACGRQALENVGAYLDGRPLKGLVTPEIFARST